MDRLKVDSFEFPGKDGLELKGRSVARVMKMPFSNAVYETRVIMRIKEIRSVKLKLIQICLIVCLPLIFVSLAGADQNSRLLNLFAEYEETKEDLLIEMSNANRMRKQERKIDSLPIQQLAAEGLQLLQQADILYGEEKTNAARHPAEAGALPVLYALKVACGALYQTASNELEYESREKSAFILTIRLSYEDLLRTADAELKRTMAQRKYSAPSINKDSPGTAKQRAN
jgi:hypothetical protein